MSYHIVVIDPKGDELFDVAIHVHEEDYKTIGRKLWDIYCLAHSAFKGVRDERTPEEERNPLRRVRNGSSPIYGS